jgi:hypothetical protein
LASWRPGVLAAFKVTELSQKFFSDHSRYGFLHSISSPTFYKWKARYGGLGVSELKRLKELEAENSKLKRMYADLALENTALMDVIEKKL